MHLRARSSNEKDTVWAHTFEHLHRTRGDLPRESIHLHRPHITLASFHLSGSALTSVWPVIEAAPPTTITHTHTHTQTHTVLLHNGIMSHAGHLNVKYWGAGCEPFPTTLPANASRPNNLYQSRRIKSVGFSRRHFISLYLWKEMGTTIWHGDSRGAVSTQIFWLVDARHRGRRRAGSLREWSREFWRRS